MHEDLVSIIVPVFNSQDFLERTMQSLLGQTYSNIEIILIEGFSSDSSYEMCLDYQRRNSNIIVIRHEENYGPERARNDGIDAASGKWFIFVDSDDMLVPTAIEEMVESAQRWDCDILFSGYELVEGETRRNSSTGVAGGCYTRKQIAEMLMDELSLPIVSCVGSKLYKTELAKSNSLRVDIACRHNADLAFTMDALMCAKTIGVLDRPLYVYILRSSSMSFIYRLGAYETIAKTRSKVKRFLIGEGVFEQKKYKYYDMRRVIFIDALSTEIRFHKDFNEAFDRDIADPEINEAVDYLLRCHLPPRTRLMLFLIKGRHKLLLKWSISLYLRLN